MIVSPDKLEEVKKLYEILQLTNYEIVYVTTEEIMKMSIDEFKKYLYYDEFPVPILVLTDSENVIMSFEEFEEWKKKMGETGKK